MSASRRARAASPTTPSVMPATLSRQPSWTSAGDVAPGAAATGSGAYSTMTASTASAAR